MVYFRLIQPFRKCMTTHKKCDMGYVVVYHLQKEFYKYILQNRLCLFNA